MCYVMLLQVHFDQGVILKNYSGNNKSADGNIFNGAICDVKAATSSLC